MASQLPEAALATRSSIFHVLGSFSRSFERAADSRDGGEERSGAGPRNSGVEFIPENAGRSGREAAEGKEEIEMSYE
jgi:hypothetical protein